MFMKTYRLSYVHERAGSGMRTEEHRQAQWRTFVTQG